MKYAIVILNFMLSEEPEKDHIIGWNMQPYIYHALVLVNQQKSNPYTHTQDPNTVCSSIIFLYDTFQAFTWSSTGGGHQYIKEKCAMAQTAPSQSTW
jgi:hypothetical protein